MEAQVENNVKKKINKETKNRKEKKKTHMYRIESLKTWELEKILEKKELNMNSCPWLNTQVLWYFVPSKKLFLILSGIIRHK